MADRDNGKVEHPLTLGPRHWEEEVGVCESVCAHGTGGGGCRVEGRRGLLGKRDSPRGLQWHTHSQTHSLK